MAKDAVELIKNAEQRAYEMRQQGESGCSENGR